MSHSKVLKEYFLDVKFRSMVGTMVMTKRLNFLLKFRSFLHLSLALVLVLALVPVQGRAEKEVVR